MKLAITFEIKDCLFFPHRVKKGTFIKACLVLLSPICKGFFNVVWANPLSNAPLTPRPPLNPNPPGSFPVHLPFLALVLCLCYPQLIQTFWVFSWTTEPASSGLHISTIPCFQSIIHRAGRCFSMSFGHLNLLGRWLHGKEHKYEDLNSHPHYPHKIQD